MNHLINPMFGKLSGGGPYVGPKGGMYADSAHTVHWDPAKHKPLAQPAKGDHEHHATVAGKPVSFYYDQHASGGMEVTRGSINASQGKTLRDHVREHVWEKDKMHGKAGGPFIGPRGGKWADAKHTIHWDPYKHGTQAQVPKKVGPFTVVSEMGDEVEGNVAIGGKKHSYTYDLWRSGDPRLGPKDLIEIYDAKGKNVTSKMHPKVLETLQDHLNDEYDKQFEANEAAEAAEYEVEEAAFAKERATTVAVKKTIASAVKTKPTSWDKIMDAVDAKHNIPDGQWMAVREAMQELVNAGTIKRTNSVRTENYYKVKKSEDNEMSDPIEELGKLHKAMGDIPSYLQAQGGGGSSRKTAFGEMPKPAPRGGYKAESKTEERNRQNRKYAGSVTTFTGPKGGRYSDPERKHSIGKMRGKLRAKFMAGKATMEDVRRYANIASALGGGGDKKKKRPLTVDGKVYTGPKGGRYSDPGHKHGIGKSEDGMEARAIDPNALSKGMQSFYLSGKNGSLPEAYLAEYLDSFIKEAYEHERMETSHTDPNLIPHSSDITGYMAGCVFSELVAFIPHNANLKKACTKFKVSKEFVEERMRYLNLLHIDSENQNANQKASTSGYHPTPMALSMDAEKNAFHLAEQERNDAMSKAFRTHQPGKVDLAPGPDPMELLHDTLQKSEYEGGVPESEAAATAGVDRNCAFHGRDIHADPGMFPQSVTGAECSCPK